VKILVINSGSSSIKYRLFETADWSVRASGSLSQIGEPEGRFRHGWVDEGGEHRERVEEIAVPDHQEGLGRIMRALSETGGVRALSDLAAIGHRVVHGGEDFQAPTLIDERVLEGIRANIPLAPLHNPANLEGIQVARRLFPQVPQIAVFDTAFHQTMPPAAYRYALPERLYREHRVRRYGFHGSSHQYVSKRAAALLGRPLERTSLITLHLGNGASAAAVRDGRCVDTSMGMTPLEGLVMGTRSGDLDPAIHFYLCRELGYSLEEVERLLNKESGLTGLAGVNDMREIHRLAKAGRDDAVLALEVFTHRLRKYVGAYCAELGRVDALVFTGGIGENDPWVRGHTCRDLEALGILIDPAANEAPSSAERRISPSGGRTEVLVIPTNEELEIARQAWDAIHPRR
jgi:acetate kinase